MTRASPGPSGCQPCVAETMTECQPDGAALDQVMDVGGFGGDPGVSEEELSVPESEELIGDEVTAPEEPSPEKIRAEDVKPGDRILPLEGILEEPLDVKRINFDGGSVVVVGAEKTWAGWRRDWVWRYPSAEANPANG